jgi:hypothetical protein
MLSIPKPRLILPFILFTILLPLTVLGAAPQVEWIHGYGGQGDEHGFDAVALPNGGYLLAGKTSSSGAGGDDVYLVAVDEDGEVLWERVHGGAAHDVGQAVIRTDDGGFALTGYTGIPPNDYRVLLMKFDFEGGLEWQNAFGGEGALKGRDLVQTSDGGYLIIAETGFHLIRTDDQGELSWESALGSSGDQATGLSETPAGDFLLTGYHSDGRLSPEFDARLLKISGGGALVLNRTYDLGAEDQANAAIELADGDIVFCGISGGTGSLWRTTGSGAVIWRKTLPAKWTSDLLETADGGFLVSGTTYAYENGQYQVSLTQTDAVGDFLGQAEAGGAAFDYSQALVRTGDGAVVVGSAQATDRSGYNLLAVRFAVEIASVAAVGGPVPFVGLNLSNPPNPFNPRTTPVSLDVFDFRGRHVRTLIDGQSLPEGSRQTFWDGRDAGGRPLAAGVYFSRIVAGDFTETHRMTLLK